MPFYVQITHKVLLLLLLSLNQKQSTILQKSEQKPSKSKLPSVLSASVMVATSGRSCKFGVDMELGRLAARGFGAPGCWSGLPSSTSDRTLRRPSRMSLRSSGIVNASCRSDAARAGLDTNNVFEWLWEVRTPCGQLDLNHVNRFD